MIDGLDEAAEPFGRARLADEINMVRWGQEVRDALTRNNITAAAAAKELGVTAPSLSAWLSGTTDPPRKAMRPLSTMTGLSYNYLLELAHRMPDGTRAGTYQLQAAATFQDAMAQMMTWGRRWSEESQLTPAATLAGALSDHLTQWGVDLRPDMRGRKWRTRHASFVGLSPLTPDAEAIANPQACIEQHMRERMQTIALNWRAPQPVYDWPDAPELVLYAPHNERSRAPRLERFSNVEKQRIAVVGATYAHAETVGALIADALGFGYVNAVTATQERYNVTARADSDRLKQTAVVRTWLQPRPNEQIDSYVFSWADTAVHSNVESDLIAWPGALVHVKAPRQVLEYGAEVWGVDIDELTAAQKILDSILSERRKQAKNGFAGVSHQVRLDVVEDVDRHAVWDSAVEASYRALRMLTNTKRERESVELIQGQLGKWLRNEHINQSTKTSAEPADS